MKKPHKAPSVVRSWKRFMAVGCSHGNLIDHNAEDAVLTMRQRWNPHKTIHLGDFIDTAAFRAGAKGTSDESEPIEPDIDSGLDFLDDLQANVILVGNHEARLWRLTMHHNAIIRELANQIISRIRIRADKLKADLCEGWSIRDFRTVGNFKLMHGYLYSEHACRDHAEAHGNIIFAHTHRAGVGKGRRDDCPTGFCVGTLANVPNMDYASARRSTLSWAAGFVWGEYCDDRAVCWLHEQPQGQSEWRLPA